MNKLINVDSNWGSSKGFYNISIITKWRESKVKYWLSYSHKPDIRVDSYKVYYI